MARRHRKTRRERKKQRKVIIASMIGMLGLMTVGYAAFQTNLNITAKGNIIKLTTPNDLKENVVTSGPGLYKDDIEENKYIYKGEDPNNYIKLDNDLWRIISIEPDNTLKIMKQDSIGNFPYDPGYGTSISGVTNANSMEGTRWSATSTDYCYYDGSTTTYYGCNVWGSKTTMLDSNGNSITKMPRVVGNTTTYDLPEKEAYLNTYLNNTYYASLSENTKSKITMHSFNVGLLTSTMGQTLSTDISQEKAYTWKGKVGLPNATDYVRSSTDASCTSAYSGYQSPYPCKNGNFMFNSVFWWTMSPRSLSSSDFAWYVNRLGYLSHLTVVNSFGVRPVAYLSSDIGLGGSGSSSEPFTIN